MKELENKVEDSFKDLPEIVKLNVGGKSFISSKETLSKKCLFRKTFSSEGTSIR